MLGATLRMYVCIPHKETETLTLPSCVSEVCAHDRKNVPNWRCSSAGFVSMTLAAAQSTL